MLVVVATGCDRTPTRATAAGLGLVSNLTDLLDGACVREKLNAAYSGAPLPCPADGFVRVRARLFRSLRLLLPTTVQIHRT